MFKRYRRKSIFERAMKYMGYPTVSVREIDLDKRVIDKLAKAIERIKKGGRVRWNGEN
ncbi:hypothetical protein QS426_11630 [Staphylococcus pseudintermedius]|uniref:hypothetical protein n=1 Tax=Staphylococcus pseudintermedius TaxID=283734 RepID=UPI00286E96C3|nr:hypothetical protein [Staphylococcus pseudintermedius]EJG5860338.1 hypothetical protein [Staphylococcus pseudintermedius]ELJ9082706.1 hypothetical protein [Staphylococcus pseudintermedius]WMZ76045.1 hypothetical protein QS426_11630 [Staphylococcus pseudintermedius]WMZ88399.1 hypothetical protein QS436_10775 [Staphylococcus pseudintermedius]